MVRDTIIDSQSLLKFPSAHFGVKSAYVRKKKILCKKNFSTNNIQIKFFFLTYADFEILFFVPPKIESAHPNVTCCTQSRFN